MNNANQKNNILKWMGKKSTIHVILFLLAILGVSWAFGYFEIFNLAPHSIHSWRQTDSCAFVQNYYNDGMNFLQPRVHNNTHSEGFGSPSEFPILYYFTAIIWKIFQPHDGVLRVVNYLILILGYFSISKLTLHLTKDVFYALMVPLLLIGSPILAYYGFNYIPNIPALGLAFSGLLCFYYFITTEQRKWLISSWILFLFAGLLKVTVLIPFIIIILVFLLEKLDWIQFKSNGKIFKKGWINLPFLISVFVIIAGWILWVEHYNEINKCDIFITKTRPIWSLDKTAILEIWGWIVRDGAPEYYHWITRYFVFGLPIILLTFFRKKLPKLLSFFLLFIVLGSIGSFLIFYRQYYVHDYYAVEMMVLPAIVFVSFFYVLKMGYPTIGNHIFTKLVVASFVIFNLNNSYKSFNKKYEEAFIFNKNYESTFDKKMEARSFLKDLGIEYPQIVISIPDVSPNYNLNYFNLKGWTEYAIDPQPFLPWVFYSFKGMGADYLIVTDEKYLQHEHLKEFIKYPLGNFENSIFVFDLRPIPQKEEGN